LSTGFCRALGAGKMRTGVSARTGWKGWEGKNRKSGVQRNRRAPASENGQRFPRARTKGRGRTLGASRVVTEKGTDGRGRQKRSLVFTTSKKKPLCYVNVEGRKEKRKRHTDDRPNKVGAGEKGRKKVKRGEVSLPSTCSTGTREGGRGCSGENWF